MKKPNNKTNKSGSGAKRPAKKSVTSKPADTVVPPDVLFEILIQEFLDSRKSICPPTRRHYQLILKSLHVYVVAQLSPRVHLSQVKTATLSGWIMATGASPATRRNRRVMVIMLFNFAKRQGYLPVASLTEAEVLPMEKPALLAKPEIYTPTEIVALIGVLWPSRERMPVHRALIEIVLGAFAGMRSSETAFLRWHDVDFKGNRIVVRGHIDKPSRYRVVALEPNLHKFLLALKPPGAIETDLVIGPALTSSLRAAAELCAVKLKTGGLRYAYSTYRVVRGKGLEALALAMGSSVNLLRRYFLRPVSSEDARAFWKILPPVASDGTF